MPSYDYITVNFYPLMGILFDALFLFRDTRIEPRVRRHFYRFIFLTLAELLLYNLELQFQTVAGHVTLHTLVTAMGYSLRPFMLVQFLVIINRNGRSGAAERAALILAGMNILYAFSPFFTDGSFTYRINEANQFVRGRFGYFPYVVMILFFIICMLNKALRAFRGNGRCFECAIIIQCSVFIAFGAFAEGFFGCYALLRICIVAMLTGYYMFFQSASYDDEILEKTEEQAKMSDGFSMEMVRTLGGTIDAKDTYTNGHSQRVADYSREIAKRAGKSEEYQKEVYIMALLHDLGKIGVPDRIIRKRGKLTEEEYNIIKTHTSIGSNLLRNIRSKPNLYVGARWHHERYDGNGYPDNLAGKEIPEEARIIAVADAYDAMTSNRAYRAAMDQERVRGIIVENRGKQFDPHFADIMLHMIDEDRDFSMCYMENAAHTDQLREIIQASNIGVERGPLNTDTDGFLAIIQYLRKFMERTKVHVQAVLITMNPETAEARDPLRLYDKMHLLSEILTEAIRRSDLFTQINLRQFILILMDTTTDQAVIPEERIKEHFQTAENQDYSLTFEIADMDAAEKQKSPVSDGDSKT